MTGLALRQIAFYLIRNSAEVTNNGQEDRWCAHVEADKRLARAGGRWQGLGSAEFTVTVPLHLLPPICPRAHLPRCPHWNPLPLFLVPSLGWTNRPISNKCLTSCLWKPESNTEYWFCFANEPYWTFHSKFLFACYCKQKLRMIIFIILLYQNNVYQTINFVINFIVETRIVSQNAYWL